jgi:very-short-patch-repair endonuclease
MKWIEIKEIAAKLRNNPTEAEKILWSVIRNKQLLGRKFLRQHPIIYEINRFKNDFYFFVPDFYCAGEKLIIELDGPIHNFQKDKDYKREEILKSKGLKVLRIKNSELEDLELTKIKIISAFRD